MSTFQHSELLPEHEILQNKIPTATEDANQGPDPEKKRAEHGTELYQITDWKYCCKSLILRSARVLARHTVTLTSGAGGGGDEEVELPPHPQTPNAAAIVSVAMR
jgi:hypothetical protein